MKDYKNGVYCVIPLLIPSNIDIYDDDGLYLGKSIIEDENQKKLIIHKPTKECLKKYGGKTD